MTLNDCRDEARAFLERIAPEDSLQDALRLFQEEVPLLEAAVSAGSCETVVHEIYDLMFLLFEMAAISEADLDAEWEKGRIRKVSKHLGESPPQ